MNWDIVNKLIELNRQDLIDTEHRETPVVMRNIAFCFAEGCGLTIVDAEPVLKRTSGWWVNNKGGPWFRILATEIKIGRTRVPVIAQFELGPHDRIIEYNLGEY